MGEWHKQRLAELEAQAPAKRKKVKPFVFRLDLGETAKVFVAAGCAKAVVWLWLLHQTRKTGNKTVNVPNGALAKYGVSRKVKYLALRHFEQAGRIAVEWRSRKNPTVTLC